MNISRWKITGRTSLAFALFAIVGGGANDTAAKELWNIVPVSSEATLASAEALGAVAAAYDAFRASELEGVEARRAVLGSAGQQLLAASEMMTQYLSVAGGSLDRPVSLDSVSALAGESLAQWAEDRGAETPMTVGALYAAGQEATQALAEKYMSFAEREDDEVFPEFIAETSSYLRAGWASSRLFETSR